MGIFQRGDHIVLPARISTPRVSNGYRLLAQFQIAWKLLRGAEKRR
jgi:hypothetical protein